MFESYTSVTNIIWLQDKPIIRLENDEGIVDVYRREWVLFLDSWITYLSHDDRGKCVSFRRDENGKVIDFRYYLCGCFV